MKETTNLALPLALSGHVQMQRSVKRAFEILDAAVGQVDGQPAIETTFDDVTVTDASDLATAIALANALKVRINEMAGYTFITRIPAV